MSNPLESWTEEQRSAYLYRVCADAEAGTARADLFTRLAGEAAVAASDYLNKPLQGDGDRGFPVSLGAWSGREATPDSATLPYFNSADDRLSRVYVLTDEGKLSKLTPK